MTIEDAKAYINYGIKNGNYDAEQFEGMTDKELINFAFMEEMRADAAYDAWREQEAEYVID